MHRVLSSQCGLCRFPIQAAAQPNALRWCGHCYQYLTPVKRCQRCGLSLKAEEANIESICGECLSEPPLGNGYLPWETTIFRCLEKYNASKITDKHGMFAL